MVRCEYCDAVMTSAPSHIEHREACARNPVNALRAARAEVDELRDRIARVMGCTPDDDADLVEAVRLLVQERDEAVARFERTLDAHPDDGWMARAIGAEEARDSAHAALRRAEQRELEALAELDEAVARAHNAEAARRGAEEHDSAVLAELKLRLVECDRLREERDETRAVADAAREYLMRSVPDPNTGPAAEDTLRAALAALDTLKETT